MVTRVAKKTPTFEPYGSVLELKCPVCGEAFLHHDRVDVFFREEDAPKGVAVRVRADDPKNEGQPVQVGTTQEGNPSARRDGIAIRFWCENCDAVPVLAVNQHKGATQLGWL